MSLNCTVETEGSLVNWIWEDWGRSAMESVGCVSWIGFGLTIVDYSSGIDRVLLSETSSSFDTILQELIPTSCGERVLR